MTFDKQINEYISILDCTAKELASASKITPATLSRYCNGIRVPSPNGVELNHLAEGISMLAQQIASNRPDYEQEVIAKLVDPLFVKNTLLATLETDLNSNRVIENFNQLVTALDIRMNKLSKAIGYDASYLSRIKAGQRKPADMKSFVNSVCQFIVTEYDTVEDRSVIAKLLGCELSVLENRNTYQTNLNKWLSSNAMVSKSKASINGFLEHLDSFDLDEYIRSIHFDKLKIPNVPLYITRPKTYYGVDEMKEGELDFFKGTVLSKSLEPVFMCSDMPMEDMAQDLEFGKKWMFAIAMTIKKGLHMNVIHNLDRPFNELLLGLESWIPLYMTGQISPYYFKSKPSPVSRHLTYVSGVCALDGQCVTSYHEHGKYNLYTSKTDVLYYKQRSQDLLSKAHPLMEIYSESDVELLQDFYGKEAAKPGTYKNKLSVPPVYSLTYELLEKILSRTGHMDRIDEIWQESMRQRETIHELLTNSALMEEVVFLSKEEFDKYPITLSYPNLPEEICYSYEEYLEHMTLTEHFCEDNANYILKQEEKASFRNIQIRMKKDSWVIISKKKSPAIHFVIYHPQLLNAIWNFIPLAED